MNTPDAALREDDDTRSLTILNLSGDSTLTWSPANDAVMRDMIERKMKEGFAFFILRKRLKGLLPARREAVTDIEKAMASRELVMADEDFARIVGEGAANLVRTPERAPLANDDAVQSRDPALIAASQSVAVRKMAGG